MCVLLNERKREKKDLETNKGRRIIKSQICTLQTIISIICYELCYDILYGISKMPLVFTANFLTLKSKPLQELFKKNESG